jgi:hypothetical protein
MTLSPGDESSDATQVRVEPAAVRRRRCRQHSSSPAASDGSRALRHYRDWLWANDEAGRRYYRVEGSKAAGSSATRNRAATAIEAKVRPSSSAHHARHQHTLLFQARVLAHHLRGWAVPC